NDGRLSDGFPLSEVDSYMHQSPQPARGRKVDSAENCSCGSALGRPESGDGGGQFLTFSVSVAHDQYDRVARPRNRQHPRIKPDHPEIDYHRLILSQIVVKGFEEFR